MAGSNCRPARYECAALPTELIEHDRVFYAGHPLSEKPTRIQHHPRMSSSHHLTILRTSSLTIRENPRKRLGVGQLQILSPVVDSLSNRVNGCCWAVCETAAKLTSCRAAISPLRLCRVWMRPDLTGMLVRLHASKTFVSSRKSRCPPPATRRPP